VTLGLLLYFLKRLLWGRRYTNMPALFGFWLARMLDAGQVEYVGGEGERHANRKAVELIPAPMFFLMNVPGNTNWEHQGKYQQDKIVGKIHEIEQG